MAEMTREEVDTKFELAEQKALTREALASGKIDLLLEKVGALSGSVDTLKTDLKSDMREVLQDNKNTRLTIAITVIGATLAALGALWTTQGSMVTAMGNQLSAFQAALAVSSAKEAKAK